MSIVTKTGDHGTTALLFGRRVSKSDSRVAANGALDELNAALGFARAMAPGDLVMSTLLPAQKHLVSAMGEIALLPEDQERYNEKGLSRLPPQSVTELDSAAFNLESNYQLSYEHWATPGTNPASAALEVARTVCRRAERSVVALAEAGVVLNPLLVPFLNRLSDVCWLLARYLEKPELAARSLHV